jgi:transketolase
MQKTSLAPTPEKDPVYSLSVTYQGEALTAADPKALRALIALMDMHALIGGAASHFGGPSAFAELMSATFALMFRESKKANKPWHELFHFVNDAGHCENGLYALRALYGFAGLQLSDLKKFRSIDSKLTGHGEAHLFPEAILLSNGPLGSAFPQAQGLAMADKKLNNKRVTITAISDGASMEGEAREAFAAIAGLARQNLLNPFVLIISDNNTKLSGRIDQESFSMDPTFKSLETLGWKVIDLEEGHNLQKCVDVIGWAILEAKSSRANPVAIRAKTIKGFGTKKTAESSSGAHGFPIKKASELTDFIKEIYLNESVPQLFNEWIQELEQIEQQKAQAEKSASSSSTPVKSDKIQVGIATAMIKARRAGHPVVSITSDLPGSTGVAGFRKEFPADSFDVGVAESNMISVAAGFSKSGFIPVVDTFAQFGVTKGALPLTMASLSNAPMICVFSHTGFQDAADGASHQALSYLAQVSSIPHVEVFNLTCAEEAESFMTQALESFKAQNKTFIFFLGRENFPVSFGYKTYKLGEPQFYLSERPQAALLASGSMLQEALTAQKQLAESGVSVSVINPSCINRPKTKLIAEVLTSEKKLFFVDDHQEIGGMAERMIYELSKFSVRLPFESFAVQGEFGQSAYTAKDLYRKHGLDSEALVKAIKASV